MDENLNGFGKGPEGCVASAEASGGRKLPSVNSSSTVEQVATLRSEYGLCDKGYFKSVAALLKKKMPLFKALRTALFTSMYGFCDKKSYAPEDDGYYTHPKGWYSLGSDGRFRGIRAKIFAFMMKMLHLPRSVRSQFGKLAFSVRQKASRLWHSFDDPKRSSRTSRRTVASVANFALPILVALAVFGSVRTVLENGMAVEVFIDGSSVGFVEKVDTVESVKKEVEEDISKILGVSYKFEGEIDYVASFGKECKKLDRDRLYSEMYGIGSANFSHVYVMYLDGVMVGANGEKEVLEAAFETVKEKLSAKHGTAVEVLNSVEYRKEWVSNKNIVTAEELINSLFTPDIDEKTLELPSSLPTLMDAPDKLASNTKELMLLELPNKTQYSLSNTYYIPVPEEGEDVEGILSFMISEKESYTETVPYKTLYEYSEELYEGTTSVKTKGVLGKRTVTAQVSYVNGEEVEREILSSEIVSAPVDKVVVIGIKERPSTDPTGTFMRPISGKISCSWGWRTLYGQKDFHYGLDFKANVGTTVYASDGGTVVYAGPRGNYGIYIKIQHGSKYQTVYAHLSSVLVKVGDKVFKGQPIAKSGNTGMSTGPHLHFEVIVDGVKKNPAKYIENL